MAIRALTFSGVEVCFSVARMTAPTAAMVLIHMFVIGLPIAHFASRAPRPA